MNISLSSEYRGRGLGCIILRLVSNKLIKEFQVKKISAYVKTSNIASIKSFGKVGYKIKERQMREGIKILKFEYLNRVNKPYDFSHS